MTGSRLSSGGTAISRAAPLRLTFDGGEIAAYTGDSVASAFLAAGRRTVGASVLLGRPRGIVSAGSEEPTGVVGIEQPVIDPLRPAPTVEVIDGLHAVGLDGQGRLSEDAAGASYDAIHHRCEVLVVGAGPAGLAAALAAARTGVRVLLVDERPTPGGSLLTDAETAWAAALSAQLARFANVTQLNRTTVIGYYHDNFLIAVQRRTDHPGHGLREGAARERVWRIRAAEVVLATGAHERPMVFAGNDRPGVMLAESARTYLHRYGVLVGDQVVLFTTHDDAYRVAGDLLAVGAQVVVVDPRTPTGQPTDIGTEALPTGTVLAGAVVISTRADATGELVAVTVRGADGATREVPADVLAVSGGWNPAVQLYSQAGGRLRFDPDIGAFGPDGTPQRVTVAGSANGLRTTHEVVDDGERAGAAAAEAAASGALAVAAHQHTDIDANIPPLDAPEDDETYPELPQHLYLVPDSGPADEQFVDLQRDVTVADLTRATGAGLAGVEHVKRYTTAGTAHDQGKTSGLLTTAVTATLLGVGPETLGTTTFRPPYTPVAFAALAGRERGQLYDPIRTTGAHAWHVAHDAEFENVGQWKRPWYYPLPGESLGDAVARECRAARTGVAFMDGSTLGKIDVRGPDAPAFLDMLYTNLMSNLKVGSIRYGVMCNVDGMVLDDGTVFRLAADQYLVTTTTGNAAKILDWMEEWLQTEWPELQVWCTSVTEQWATMAVVGPRSRELVALVAPDLDTTDFPFMTWRDTTAAGLSARIARISFSGELAYEINVAWSDAAALWDAVWAQGSGFELTAYGTETMHVLRAEKGFPIIGQDTDGTITPQDLGMGWVVSKKKADYIGKRSHARADNARTDRKHLVGLLPADPTQLIPEGSQLVEQAVLPAPPVPMLGHVTSAYPSVALGSTFALALLKGGRDRIGQTVFAVIDGVPQPVRVVSSVLVDPESARRDPDPDLAPLGVRPATVGHGLPISPLAGFAARFAALSATPTAGVRLAEAPLTTIVNLRVAPGGPAADAVAAALGGPLPMRVGAVSYAGSDAVLGLGPDEFLIVAGPGRGRTLSEVLDTALAGQGAATDVSSARTLIRISGRNARQVLAHGCSVDLHHLPESTCAQTTLAQCAVILFSDGAPFADTDLVKVLVRSSFAAHLAEWLILTATEYA